MNKRQGLHLYINVNNFNDIVETEEKSGGVNHSIHALDTLFSSIERYGKEKYPNTFKIEKITGSRLHLYLLDTIKAAYEAMIDIVSYAARLTEFMKTNISKYKSLDIFNLQVGASYGRFYEFEFEEKYQRGAYEEMTSIGFACNYAAKLQGLANVQNIAISSSIYDEIAEDEKKLFIRRTNEAINKYGQSCYYESNISKVGTINALSDDRIQEIKNYANKRNLTDMQFTSVQKALSFDRLSVSHGKIIEGIPVFADVRDFTSQFEEDDSNLEEMAHKTMKLLSTLYLTTVDHNGVHVQFQGDREFALYHNIGDEECFKMAVLGGMRMIDAVKPYSVHIGVGEAFGKMYAVRIGAHGEKDNLLIGKTAIIADRLEDDYADEDQVAITGEVYAGLKKQDAFLAQLFVRYSEDVYITNVGYKEYRNKRVYEKQQSETQRHKYNGAWGE